MRETCPKSEYLIIDPEILKFGKDILSKSEIIEASKLSKDLTLSKKRKRVTIEKLQVKVGMKPKRPMFYLNSELEYLPYHTRDAIRYLGDYIDHLIKFYSAEKLKNNKYEKQSLGSNLRKLKDVLLEKLRSRLIKYNELIYVPAKHDFNVQNRRHRFTSKEVVFTCFITLELAKEITKLSNRAKDYSEGRIYG